MDDLTKAAYLLRHDLHVATEGEFRGWQTWTRDNFETHNGPFWHRIEEDGSIRCAFRVEKKHLNGSAKNVHGGAFMSLLLLAPCLPQEATCVDNLVKAT